MSNTRGVSKISGSLALSALVLGAGLVASQAASAQANVTLSIGGVLAPGVYGNIAIGQPAPVHYRQHHAYPAPQVIVTHPPVVYQQPPVYYQQPQVVYQQPPVYYQQPQVIVRRPVIVSPNYYGQGYGHGRGHHHGGHHNGHRGGHRGDYYGGRY